MSYIKKVRSKLGSAKFIHPAARIIIENGQGQVLFIKKRGSGQLGIPAGGMEENETIEQCIKREVREETGLTIHSLEVLGISSNPTQETVTYSNGDCIQYFTVEFYTKDWSGTIKVEDGEEILSAAFLPKEMYTALPKIEQSIFKSFDYY
ncbi:MAG: NUDIX domain-containing protein, partial [Bacteroidota bacterium]